MSLLRKIEIPFSDDAGIDLLETKPNTTRFTAFIGENGTRKSYLLRALVDSALEEMDRLETTPAKRPRPSKTEFINRPRQILAVSAVPTDRFPAKRAWRGSRRYVHSGYVYVGPRTGGNLVSRNHAAWELILHLLLQSERMQTKRDFAKELFSTLNITGRIQFGLYPAPTIRNAGKEGAPPSGLKGHIGDILEATSSHPPYTYAGDVLSVLDKTQLLAHAEEVDHYLHQFARRSALPSDKQSRQNAPFQVYISFDDGSIDPGSVSCRSLAVGVAAGYLRPTRLRIDDFDHEQMSAGQWNMLSSLLSIAFACIDYSLVLIDEPENGLHPAWQQSYTRLVRSAIADTEGCHVVLATHAPLVLSSLPLVDCDVFRLTLSEAGQIQHTTIQPTTGWEAGALLEDVFQLPVARGEVLTTLFDDALALIANGVKSTSQREQLSAKLVALAPYIDVLPDGDPLRSMYRAMGDLTQ